MSHDARPSRRIAVISRDGIGVNERFHRAADCVVWERHGNEVRFVDRRALPASPGRVFRDYLALANLVADCGWVIALAFSGEAKRELAARGFRLHEARGAIASVILALPADSFTSPN
ncbi:MAG: hypothetical protein EXS13_03030 [Planctomycetes bacterium]|nr:hypothetical protein [Planctomycetota bacterium]